MGRKAKVEEKVEKVPRILKKNNVKSKMNFTHVKTEYEPNTGFLGNPQVFSYGLFGTNSMNSPSRPNSGIFGGSSNSNLLFGGNHTNSNTSNPSTVFGNSNPSNTLFDENSNIVKPISTFNVGPYKLGIFQMF